MNEKDNELRGTYFYNGLAKYNSNDFEGAIADYTKVIEIDPSIVLAYLNRALAKLNSNDFEGAISDYTKAIEINPSYAKGYVNRGNVKDKLENHQEAIYDYTKAIDIDPSYANAYCYRGVSKSMSIEYDQESLVKDGMFSDLRKAIELGSQLAKDFLIQLEKNIREEASSNSEDADGAAKMLKEYFDNDIALKANGMIDIRFFQSFYTLLEGEEEKATRSNDIAPAIPSSLFRIRGLFEPDDVLVNEELEEDFDLIKELTNADEFEKWLKPQLEYQTQLSPIDSCLGTTFFIGDSEEMNYKTIDEFLMDMDYEKASNIVRDCFEKAKEALKNNP